MIFEWDDAKDRSNQRKHGVSFRTATFAFNDPLHNTVPGHLSEDGELRWKTLGLVYGRLLLFVAHTLIEEESTETIVRIISARAATAAERHDYEDG
jgi:uncharacterized DUF497 family protein